MKRKKREKKWRVNQKRRKVARSKEKNQQGKNKKFNIKLVHHLSVSPPSAATVHSSHHGARRPSVAQHLISPFTPFTITIVPVQAALKWESLNDYSHATTHSCLSPSQPCCCNTCSYNSIGRYKIPYSKFPKFHLLLI